MTSGKLIGPALWSLMVFCFALFVSASCTRGERRQKLEGIAADIEKQERVRCEQGDVGTELAVHWADKLGDSTRLDCWDVYERGCMPTACTVFRKPPASPVEVVCDYTTRRGFHCRLSKSGD